MGRQSVRTICRQTHETDRISTIWGMVRLSRASFQDWAVFVLSLDLSLERLAHYNADTLLLVASMISFSNGQEDIYAEDASYPGVESSPLSETSTRERILLDLTFYWTRIYPHNVKSRHRKINFELILT